MDYSTLPHFCRRQGSGSSRYSSDAENCFSLDHTFHQQLYNYIKQQALGRDSNLPIKQGSFHVSVPDPDPEGVKIAETIESEMQKFEDQNMNVNGGRLSHSMNGLKLSSK